MLRISLRGKPCERLDGEPAQPLALGLDPDVIVAVGKQGTAGVATVQGVGRDAAYVADKIDQRATAKARVAA